MVIKNTIANFAGQFVNPVLAIIFVPFYIHSLGLEGYGIVGFFSTLTALLNIFTKGIGWGLQREITRRYIDSSQMINIKGLVYTFELFYWKVGIILGILLSAFSGQIGTKWIKAESLSSTAVKNCLIVISVTIALSFPRSVYKSVFWGTQRQVLGNLIVIISDIIFSIIAFIAVLIWKSVFIFYVIGLISNIGVLFISRYWAYKIIYRKSETERKVFSWEELKRLGISSIGLVWIHGIGLLIKKVDRILIGTILKISELGIYTAATSPGKLIGMIYSPFLAAVYPQTCEIVITKIKKKIEANIIRNSKVIIVMVLACGFPISFFSEEILKIWTRNEKIAANGALLAAIFIYGNICNSLTNVFYQTQVALNITRFAVYYNSIAVVWYPLSMWYLIHRYGLKGAAISWLLYCGFGWLYNLIITSMVINCKYFLFRYMKELSINLLIAAGVNISLRFIADSLFYRWIVIRFLIACVAVFFTFILCYSASFGFRIPLEFKEIYRKIFNKVILNNE